MKIILSAHAVERETEKLYNSNGADAQRVAFVFELTTGMRAHEPSDDNSQAERLVRAALRYGLQLSKAKLMSEVGFLYVFRLARIV